MEEAPSDITHLLQAWGQGDSAALDRLTPLVYHELHRMAQRYMRREQDCYTLQTTALVNEAYLRLVNLPQVSWRDRTHFFAISANLMRRILVDAARSRGAAKRGGEAVIVDLNESIDAAPIRPDQLIRLDDALFALAQFDSRKAKVVELRFFGGLTVEETAEVLHISPDSVVRDWRLSRSWLMRELKSDGPRPGPGESGRPASHGKP